MVQTRAVHVSDGPHSRHFGLERKLQLSERHHRARRDLSEPSPTPQAEAEGGREPKYRCSLAISVPDKHSMILPVLVGQYRRSELLGTTATYRVVEMDGDHVFMTVVDVPGLPVGMRVRMTLAAVAAMDCVGLEPGSRRDAPRRVGAPADGLTSTAGRVRPIPTGPSSRRRRS